MVDGEGDCDKGSGGNRCYHDMVHQGDLRDRGERARASHWGTREGMVHVL